MIYMNTCYFPLQGIIQAWLPQASIAGPMVYLGVMLAPCLREVNDEAMEFLGPASCWWSTWFNIGLMVV